MSTFKFPRFAAIALALAISLSGSSSAQDFGEVDPALTEAFEAGKAAFENGNYDEAIAKFEEAKKFDTDRTFSDVYFWSAEALREVEDYTNAIANYQEALRVQPEFAPAHNGIGICWREQGDYDVARNSFENAVKFDRRYAEAAANLGDIYVNTFGDPLQAMPHLDRAIELNPEDAESLRNRGLAHARLQEFEEGITDLTKSIELDASDYKTYELLSNVYQAEEELEESIDAMDRAIETYEPEDNSEPDIFINGLLRRATLRMLVAKEEDQIDENKAVLFDQVVNDSNTVIDEYPDRFPESGLAKYRLGTAKRMQGLYAEAITALTDAIQLIPPGRESPYTSEAFLLRGICWFYQGQTKLARGDFKEAASLSFSDPLPHLWIGYTQAKEGDYRKAIESYGEAASKSPTFALAYVNRGLAYMQLEDYEKAADNFNKAIRAEPTEPKHYYKSGLAREKLGKPDEARAFFDLALQRNGEYVEAHRAIARAYRALGRDSLAENHERKADELEANQASE